MPPYVGEIRMFAGNFAPVGWMFCEGQLLPISEYETLFILIGTTYGGDGESTFALPDLRGRIPVHRGNGITFAESAGTETVTLTTNQIPSHNHAMMGTTTNGASNIATNNVYGASSGFDLYIADPDGPNLNTAALKPEGGNQPHDNFMPYTCLNFIISLFGIFPSPT